MTESNPLKNSELNPHCYLNWMVIAMIVGFIAAMTIAYGFIYGMIVYLIMQLCLIFSFSGIITLNPAKFRAQPHLFRKIVVIILIWLLLIPTIYFALVYSGPDSLVVIPYVIIIGVMACLSWFGIVYDHRSRLFRWLMVIASGLFVFSDTLVGNAEYGTIEINLNFLIDITYVLNIS
ncbi:MAG: lysoplasmalogenase family protein [Candidatus Hodarchaeota archaeon]